MKKRRKKKKKARRILRSELKAGMRIEREHSKNPKVIRKIAIDHLTENPRYYSLLKKAGLA